MGKKQLLLLLGVCSLLFVGCNDTTNNTTKANENTTQSDTINKDLSNLDISIKHTSVENKPLAIQMTIVNNSNATILFNESDFPSGNGTLGNDYFEVLEDGRKLSYIGPMASRVPHEIELKSEGTYNINTLYIAENYDVTRGAHRYEIRCYDALNRYSCNTLEFDATIN